MDPVPTQATSSEGDVIIGRSPAMQEVYKAIGLVASQNVTVLIRGESGTGKELVARALYKFSKRSTGAVPGGQLCGDPGNAARERIVRPRTRFVYGCGKAADRQVRAVQGRHTVSGRDWRHAAVAAEQIAARAPGEAVPTCRRRAGDLDRRPRDRRDEPATWRRWLRRTSSAKTCSIG